MKNLGLRALLGVAFVVLAAGSSVAQERGIVDITRPGAALTAEDLAGKFLTVQPAQPGLVYVLPAAAAQTSLMVPLQFALNSADISPQSFQFLLTLAQALYLPQMIGRPIVIEGHTDLSGTFEYNLRLSQQRAEAVRAYLIGFGVAPQRLIAVGLGPTKLLPGLNPYDGRNRRVEIVNTL